MDTVVLILVFSTFLLAGMIKGVIGLGLPTVSLAILTVVIGLPQAMALLLASPLLPNVCHPPVVANATTILKRICPITFFAYAIVWLGVIPPAAIDCMDLPSVLVLSRFT